MRSCLGSLALCFGSQDPFDPTRNFGASFSPEAGRGAPAFSCHGNVSAKYPSLSSFVILWSRFVFAFLCFMLFLNSLCTLRSSSAHQSWIALLMSYVSSNSERSHLKFLRSFLSLLSSLDCACALPRSSLQLMYFLLSLAVFSLVCGYAGAAALERRSGSSRPHPGSWRGGGEP